MLKILRGGHGLSLVSSERVIDRGGALERDRLKSTHSSYVLSSNFIALLIALRFNLKRYCSIYCEPPACKVAAMLSANWPTATLTEAT